MDVNGDLKLKDDSLQLLGSPSWMAPCENDESRAGSRVALLSVKELSMKTHYVWEESYKAAILEIDREKPPDRVHAAKAAIGRPLTRIAARPRRYAGRKAGY